MENKKALQISIIKTNIGKCFITDCNVTSGYSFDYHNTQIDKLLFDGHKATETFAKNWFEIPTYPEKVEALITGEKQNRRFKLKDKELQSTKLPLEIPYDERNVFDEDVLYSLYSLTYDVVPDYLVLIDVNFNLICEVDNFRETPEFNYPAVRKYDFSDQQYSVINQNIKHSLIDSIIVPAPLLASSPCKISSKEMYDLVRQHVKDNINPKLARITSDYDFCFEVKKIIPLLEPCTFSYRDMFARTKKQRGKIHFKTATSKEITIYEMTHNQRNYNGYTPIKEFSASNEWELKEMIDNFLSELMDVIHAPIEECPHCNGTGYLQNEE
ncbi:MULTISPECIES: hypothetical protein [Xenorhabdus]|uniref:hypothetical protein n=1 Tax=Xenorhabdus TaxID=626 RepID=UPI0006493CE8|nr:MULTISPECIES: hypothetical protein [Xenorhabdus]KLU15020.1 hypothetical protein AAY47_13170 [Xenorhabdus griffiniae]KOP35162.1 hypothetical protein AFK69_00620 [Xenorhabdus sp. GDc328]